MAAFARDGNFKSGDGGRAGSFQHINRAEGSFGIDVNSEKSIHLVGNAFFNKGAGPAGQELFTLLENKVYRAFYKIFMGGEDFGNTHEHSCMSIMTASMHNARFSAFKGKVAFFRKAQGIDVGAQADRRSRLRPDEIPDRTVAGNPV